MCRSIGQLAPERHVEVMAQLAQASSPGFDFVLLVVLSCSIATFGLIVDSPAVIIGAMLVAPLMSPILGLSLASVAGRQVMFRQAAAALTQGALVAIVLSALLGWLARVLPFDVLNELPTEVLARIHPTPFDLGIAPAGGAAAAYALAQPHLSATLPGVAIATALMPPLCMVGLGLALQRANVVIGASLLFLTNLSAIAFAGIIVFALLGFRPKYRTGGGRELHVAAGLVLLVALPLVTFSLRSVAEVRAQRNVREAIRAEVTSLPNTQVIEIGTTQEHETLHIDATVRTTYQPTYQDVARIQKAIANRLDQPVQLILGVVPMIELAPYAPPTRTPTPTAMASPTSATASTPAASVTAAPADVGGKAAMPSTPTGTQH